MLKGVNEKRCKKFFILIPKYNKKMIYTLEDLKPHLSV